MRGERGATTPVVAVVGMLLMVLAGCAAVVLAYAGAQHRARGAADLVAVAGAQAYAAGNACRAAGRAAELNGVRLVSCEAVGDAVEHVVRVEVELVLDQAPRGLPATVRGRADAGVNGG